MLLELLASHVHLLPAKLSSRPILPLFSSSFLRRGKAGRSRGPCPGTPPQYRAWRIFLEWLREWLRWWYSTQWYGKRVDDCSLAGRSLGVSASRVFDEGANTSRVATPLVSPAVTEQACSSARSSRTTHFLTPRSASEVPASEAAGRGRRVSSVTPTR